MNRPKLEPGASPAIVPADLRKLIRETYLDIDQRLTIMTIIDRHVEYMNKLGQPDAARQWLLDQKMEIGEDAKRLKHERLRGHLRLVLRATIPFAAIVASKYMATYFGL